MLTRVEIFGKPALELGKWHFLRDRDGHVRVVYSDVAAIELHEEDWQRVKDFLDADAEAAPA